MASTPRSAAARQWFEIGQAMAAQVQRVNDRAAAADPDTAAHLRELRAENQRLLDQLADAQALIADLKDQLDSDSSPLSVTTERGRGEVLSSVRRLTDGATGRPIGTQTALARIRGVKPYTISRLVSAGRLETCGRYVYLDQPIPVKGY